MPKDSASTTTSRTRSSRGGSKRQKDPNAPKRPLTAYMYYATDMREQVKQENPNATFGDVGKIIGDKWRQLGAEEKKVYEEKAVADKKRYEDEKAAYKKE